MFGYLTAEREKLTPEENARYKEAYCGLCRNLRERYGQLSGLTLNYDMCFLLLLLQSLYEAEEQRGEDRCPVHLREKQPWWQCRFTDYCADMNLALSYLKLRDDWEDDGNLAALTASLSAKRIYDGIRERYPRQCGAMERSLEQLRTLEKENRESPDEAAETFAVLMAEVFVCQEDRWSDTLRSFGAGLGRFLYIVDACVDLDRDTFRNSYNPFRRRYGRADNGEYFRRILRMLLGECLFYFDRLPLVEDTGLLKNVLCFGLWLKFDKKFKTDGKV